MNECPLTLIVPLKAYNKIMAYTQLVDTEITGFADVTLDLVNKQAIVDEVYLIEQEATGAHVEMDEESVSKFNLWCIEQGMTQLPRLWWHSHVNMETFFSKTDSDTYEETLNNGSWTIALVVNKHRSMKAVFQQYAPFPFAFDMDIRVLWDETTIPASLKKEVEKKVKEKTWPAYGVGKKSYQDGYPSTVPEHLRESVGGDEDAARSVMLTVGGVLYERILYLPKDSVKAKERIRKSNLIRRWSVAFDDWVYVDEIEGSIWKDHWSVVDPYDVTITAEEEEDVDVIYKGKGKTKRTN